MDEYRALEQLNRSEALKLLGSVSLGRLVFTHQALPAVRPVNHLVVVTRQLATSRPDVVRSLYELLKRAKVNAGPADVPDLLPFGVEANRRPLERMIDYCVQQALIPRRVAVDELFDDTTRDLN